MALVVAVGPLPAYQGLLRQRRAMVVLLPQLKLLAWRMTMLARPTMRTRMVAGGANGRRRVKSRSSAFRSAAAVKGSTLGLERGD